MSIEYKYTRTEGPHEYKSVKKLERVTNAEVFTNAEKDRFLHYPLPRRPTEVDIHRAVNSFDGENVDGMHGAGC